MNNAVILPLAVPLATAIAAQWFRQWPRLQVAIAIVGHIALLAAATYIGATVMSEGMLVGQMSNWPAPFGITVAIDRLGASLVWVTAAIGLAVAVFAAGDIDEGRRQSGFWPMVSILIMGVNGAFTTGDLFNLYVWFEVLLMSSFVLLSIGNRPLQVEASVKYVSINLVSSTAFLIATAMLYGVTGTLNMADLSQKIAASDNSGLVTTVAVLLIVAFGIKAAVFPVYFWLPSAYPAPPAVISALFAALLSKVGVYSLLRSFTLLFYSDEVLARTVLLWVSGATMIVGVLGAMSQIVLRHAFSFHLIVAIGFMMMGVAVRTEESLSATVFYLLADMIVIAGLFLTGGVVERITGQREITKMGGLYDARPLLCVAYLVPAFSVAGFPPLSGFWGKVGLLKATYDAGYPVMVAIALITSTLALISVGQLWSVAFWRPSGTADPRPRRRMTAAAVVLAAITLFIGLAPGPLYHYTQQAASDLVHPDVYVEKVLGSESP